MAIRVALLIPSVLLRSGLRALLQERAEIHIVGAAASIQGLGNVSDPDVVILSPAPGVLEDLLEFLGGLRAEPAVLVVGGEGEDLSGLDALPVRAWGALPGDASEEELLAAVQALDAGLNVQTPSIYHELLNDARRTSPVPENELVEDLTDREREVLQLLAQGLANKQIALALSISEHTVKFHVSSIYGKFGAANRTEAVRLGLQNGLITL